jgi:quinol monooxygenase YgiN
MIIVTANITANPGKRGEIISKSEDLIKSTRLESGCINYGLYANTENDNILLVFEQWENIGELELHMETDHFKTFDQSIKDLLAEDVEITIFSGDKI